jgi:hypothetical protein
VHLAKFSILVLCFGLANAGEACTGDKFTCSNLDACGSVDLGDFATLAVNLMGCTARIAHAVAGSYKPVWRSQKRLLLRAGLSAARWADVF